MGLPPKLAQVPKKLVQANPALATQSLILRAFCYLSPTKIPVAEKITTTMAGP
jgi:hypothetical protein